MKISVSSAMVKICEKKDCLPIKSGVCLENESFAFQVFLESEVAVCKDIRIEAEIPVNVYQVKNKKGAFDSHVKTEDYFIQTADDMYPELLLKVNQIEIEAKGAVTLFIEIPANAKRAGEYEITLIIGDDTVKFTLTVLPQKLEESDLILTNWMHLDGICHYYKVEPFSDRFYQRFIPFLEAYVKMGNTMLLIPLFTPPLDTETGGERLTTQLVYVQKRGENYEFDFSELKKYILLAKEYGIRYFEFSHLFTQWGGECAPKIMAEENGEYTRIFGWNTPSDSTAYWEFLRQFFTAFLPFVRSLSIENVSYLHLTDEPNEKHVKTYEKLSTFVRELCGELQIMDALSHYDFMKRNVVDLPAVCMSSDDYELFKDEKRLLYYCVYVDKGYISNRYFHMPLLRTSILGMLLYLENVKGLICKMFLSLIAE